MLAAPVLTSPTAPFKATSTLPETTAYPPVLVRLPPVNRPSVSVTAPTACTLPKFTVAPPLTKSVPELNAPAPLRIRVPPRTSTVPASTFAPLRFKVPVPVFTKVTESVPFNTAETEPASSA